MEFFKKNSLSLDILIGIVVGVIATILISKWIDLETLEFSTENLIVLSTIIICFVVVKFIRDAGLKADKNSEQSLGMPAGTIRATIALVLIVFFVLIALYAIIAKPETANLQLVENILTTLATLVISAVSFYFGVKATEQGSEIAQRIFGKTPQGITMEKVPLIVLQEALNKHKKEWIDLYRCRDISIGKKQTQDGQVDLDCLVFFVIEKQELSILNHSSTEIIPPTITFTFKEKDYSIPTDVRPYLEVESQTTSTTEKVSEGDFKKLHLDAQKGLIRDFIRINASDLIKEYPEIQGITAFKKISGNIQMEYYAIQFKVVVKDPNISSVNMIPSSFVFDNGTGKKYTIPTDIIEVGLVEEAIWRGQNENIKSLGLSVSRGDSLNTGSIGLKVNWKGKNYLMTCCHVLFNDEINANPEMTSFEASEIDVVSPGKFDNQEGKDLQVIGKLKYGWYDSFLDLAFAELVDESKLKNIPYLKNNELNGIKDIISEKDNGTEVKLFGRTSHEQEGKIVNYSQQFLNIPGRKRALFELIECDFKSEKGDSGGVVIESGTNKIIGILVAKSKRGTYSYVISIKKIINLLNLEKSTNSWIS